MNLKQIEELMEKAKAATPGPWTTEGGSNLYVIAVDDGMVAQMRGTEFGRTDLEQGNNAKLIAAANPQVILDLCERVLGLSEALEQACKMERHRSLHLWQAFVRLGVK